VALGGQRQVSEVESSDAPARDVNRWAIETTQRSEPSS
jgi:hypothetical protein